MAGGVHGRGCLHGGDHALQAGGGCMAGETDTAAAGTHPTGMHSFCLFAFAIGPAPSH